MAAQIRQTMRTLAIYQFAAPEQFDIATLPTPKISLPDEVLIKVHSASIIRANLSWLVGRGENPHLIVDILTTK